MDEVIKDARINRKTIHITFFDLEDALGSVPHNLIEQTLKRNYFPPEVIDFVQNLYANSEAKVVTSSWESEPFPFRRGVFQGDPYSPIIFIQCFNPIIEDLINKSEYGYNLNGEDIISLPYADDFCLITTNKLRHQKMINEINANMLSMGLKLKPSKCRSFSLRSGKPTVVDFNIGENSIPSIAHEEQKFLGKVVFFSGKHS